MKLQQCMKPEFDVYLAHYFDYLRGDSLEILYENADRTGRCFQKIKKQPHDPVWYEFVEDN